jgi:hypothetical protein
MLDHLARFKPLLFILAAAVLLGLTAYKADVNAQRRMRHDEHARRLKAANALGIEAAERVRSAFQVQLTMDAFEAFFGPVMPLSDADNPREDKMGHRDNMTHRYIHEDSQSQFLLRFKNDRLYGYSYQDGMDDGDTGVVLETPVFRATEAGRELVLGVSFIAWLLVFLWALRAARFRHKAGLLLVVLSTIYGLCWLLDPYYTLTPEGLLSNDNLAISVLMLICSVCVYLYAPAWAKPAPAVYPKPANI